jgi:hypothetical protein
MADESQRNSATSSFVAYGTRAADLSEAAQGVAALIEALVKTARAGRLYAPNNRALANFRDVLLGLFGEYFADHEELTLQVRPDRFLWGPEGEAVYEDGDREHGFPFRLYRDGIRVLTLVVGITDDELMELVRILGQRTIGQLEEEDLATRLWSMRSEHIRYRQVSGFVDATLRPRAGGKDNAEGLVARALAEPVEGLPVPAPLDAPARTPSELQGRWLDEWSFPPIRKRRDDEPIFATLDAGQIQEFHGGLAFDPAVLLCHVIARCVIPAPRRRSRRSPPTTCAICSKTPVTAWWRAETCTPT